MVRLIDENGEEVERPGYALFLFFTLVLENKNISKWNFIPVHAQFLFEFSHSKLKNSNIKLFFSAAPSATVPERR